MNERVEAVPSTRGGAVLQKGFRPFFLLAALHAVVFVPLWLLVQAGVVGVGTYFIPTDWHAHEMVFGFSVAVVSGFLLTAAANWTKRETATGGLLLLLCLLWLAGRVTLVAAGGVPPALVAVVNLAFLPALAVVLGRVIFRAKSRRNYGIVLVLVALWIAQLVSHVGALEGDILLQRRGVRLGIGLILVLIAVIGGRVIPLFTGNATGAEVRRHPKLDVAAIAGVVVCAVADTWLLVGPALGVIMGVTAVLTALRARHWGLRQAFGDPLLWVLHVGYLCLPLGLSLRALAVWVPAVQASAALHVLTVGCIGLLTLGMMVRVALGHTGRPIRSSSLMTLAFVLLVVATVTRVVGPLLGGSMSTSMIHLAGTAWPLAFILYLLSIGPMLLRPRVDGRPG